MRNAAGQCSYVS